MNNSRTPGATNQLFARARDLMTVDRLVGDPIERDGTLIIPVVSVRGAGGFGEGTGTNSDGSAAGAGEGGGFGVSGRPVGAYVMRDGHVEWTPAVDVVRMFVTLCLTVAVLLLSRRTGSG